MASSKGRVALSGRFPPGARVRLVKVDGPHVLRAPDGAEPVATARVGEDGRVVFEKGVEIGARYLICGYHHGQPLDVRAVGRSVDDPSVVLEQAPTPVETQRSVDLDRAKAKQSKEAK